MTRGGLKNTWDNYQNNYTSPDTQPIKNGETNQDELESQDSTTEEISRKEISFGNDEKFTTTTCGSM